MSQSHRSASLFSSLFHPVDLTEGPCRRTILKFSLPIILSYLLQQVYTLSDAAIIGQTLSADEVAGVNDINAIVFIFLQFAYGVSAGFSVISSCRIGAQDKEGVRRSFATQIILSALLSVALTAIALLTLPALLAWIHLTPESPAVYRAGYTYCAVVFAGIAALLFYNFLCSFMRALGDSVTPLCFLLFSTVLNIGLDLLFIIAFGWGVAGAAGATVLAQCVSAIASLIFLLWKYPDVRPRKSDFRLTRSEAGAHLSRGIPLGLQFSVLAIGLITMQGVVVKFDMRDGVMVQSAAQNGFGAANKLNNLVSTPLSALGTAMTSFAGQNLGAGKLRRIRRGTLDALVIMVMMTAFTVGCGMLLTINDTYLHLFLSADKVTPETVRYGNTYLYVSFVMMVFLGSLFVIRNAVQGIGCSGYVLAAGGAELVARILICLFLPAAFAGGVVDADAPAIAFYALAAGDPGAWLASNAVLSIPFIRHILRLDYRRLGIPGESGEVTESGQEVK